MPVRRPLARPLRESSVALVTSAGLTQAGQPPMDGENIEGDYTLRLLDIDTPVSELRIWHTHFDVTAANQDINVVYPVDRLKDLAVEGTVARGQLRLGPFYTGRKPAGEGAALDAVVSAPTSVSWISAAAGVPTFKILYNKSWTSFGRDYEPFAPAARCIMPVKSGDWTDAFACAASALRAMLPRA